MSQNKPVNIAIFASGNGSNTEQVINYMRANPQLNIKVDLILTNRADAFVIERAKKLGVDYSIFNKETFIASTEIINLLKNRAIEYIVLAGFLWLIPKMMLEAYPKKIINIHPALLPKYGGKGMYGYRIHHAVVENKELETGITIHLVDAIYDNGKILKQEKCSVMPNNTPQEIATKIHLLEKEFFPPTIASFIQCKK